MAFEKKDLPKKSEDLSAWYNRIILQAELADYGPAKGTMIFRPYGYAIWEHVRTFMDRDIKARGVENAYFPMFIPESLLKKEEKHVEGFSPELAVVTIGGGEELAEKLVVRPTSETIMYDAYSRWVQSWRDLPLMINQWNNVVRWEKRTYLFLRTTEFLWQEGHTAHASHEEAQDMVNWALELYTKVYRECFALPGHIGKKSDAEKFAGAAETFTYETLMPEGKVLQSATSHDLGQNFSVPFDISYQDKDGAIQYAWQTSWGLSTRSIGAMLMVHGDDQGLRLPPAVAPIQAVILPVKADEGLISFAHELSQTLKADEVRAHLDDRENESLGFKINKWELRGVPLRIEIGTKEVEQKMLTVVRRDTGEKMHVPYDGCASSIQSLLGSIQENLYEQASIALKSSTRDVGDYAAFRSIMESDRGFLRAFWCEDPACEKKIKDETKATTRCLESHTHPEHEEGVCIICGKPAEHKWLFGQSY